MANLRECTVCREAQKRKHKHDRFWKIGAIVSTIVAVLFICLYFGSGEVFETTEIDNEVSIENEGGGNPYNANIANIQAWKEKDDNNILIAIVVGIVGIGIGAYGGYLVAKNNHKKQSVGKECKNTINSEDDDKD